MPMSWMLDGVDLAALSLAFFIRAVERRGEVSVSKEASDSARFFTALVI